MGIIFHIPYYEPVSLFDGTLLAESMNTRMEVFGLCSAANFDKQLLGGQEGGNDEGQSRVSYARRALRYEP